ncbi:mucin-19 [Camelus bactrianus]|uniref:Mucin-19 n=1 Tax=Camelus bactrianus TaxID=9837 RepID=A0AC58RBY2_CAMBA
MACIEVVLMTIILYSAGGSNAKNESEYPGGISEDSGLSLGSSDQQGFEVGEIGGNGNSNSGSAGAEYLSLGSDISASGVTGSSDNSTSGPLSIPEKGSHIPEATPKYSETNAIVGEASTWGTGAYKAFNGRVFSFESSCTYTFCRHCIDSGGDFNIEVKRSNDSEIEKIAVIIDNNDISIFGDIILVNGESVQIPYNNKLIHIKKYGEHNVLNSRRGILSLMWDKINKLSLTLHKQYPTCGLCGNFNSTPGDDINEHIANSKITGNCPNAVSKSYEVCEDGVEYCDKIIGTYFEQCGKVSALSNDYRMICISEYCQNRDKNSTCDTYSELSRLCASDGPGTYESWRDDSDVVCEKPTCPENHIYKECGPSNPATCSNVAPFQDIECVSGCTCLEGYLLDDIGEKGKCVLKADCPCESNGKVYQAGEVREGPCGSECTCQEAKWSCTELLCPGRCKVEGSLITTFDGVKYNHPGNCHYLAIHDEDWSISVELRPCPSGQSGTCLNSVTLLLNSSVSVDKYIFNRDGTVTNDKIRNQGYYYSDQIQIFKVSSSYLQAETYFHTKIQIQIAPVMQLYISMPPNQFTDTVGLCGSYNNRAEDDFMSSQNILEKTSQAFASSWEMMSCPKGSSASCISIETERFAEKHCGILLDSSGPFASCHPIVNPKLYHEECKKYTCTCENSQDCLCTILGNYVKACAEKETYIEEWRNGRCDHSCPSGLVFKYNVKACNTSCRSLSERDRSCDVEDVPVDGCTCPDGMYQNNEGNCVPKSQCDCYINDEVIKPGKLISIDDNKCVCQDGILLCQTPIDLTLQNCSGGAEYIDCSDPKAQTRVDTTCSTRNIPIFDENLPCRRGCYCPVGMVRNSKGNCVFPEDCPCSFGGREYDQGSVTPVGCNKCTCIKGSWNCTQDECQTTCHIYGEGHVRTFDGRSYSFDGLCQYSFLEDYCGDENGTFRILTESVPCCEDGLTCSRKIIVAFQDQNVVLHDGKVTAVKTTESKECELDGNLYTVHTVGLYLVLKFSNGITVIWDKNTRMSVILDPRWNGKVCGLCGNNNGDLKDDFTTRYSSVAAGALEFGNSWKTSQECSDTVTQTFPCDSNPYCKAWAVRKCELIRDSTFRDCHSKVDPSEYYDACIEEACACDMEGKYLGFCTAVAMYAEACSAVGVCVTWRKPDLCPVYCDYYNAPGEFSWHYEPCGTVTAKTCKDRVIGQKFSALLEGCYATCPDSAPYLDENTMKCVSLSECSCFYNDVIPAGGVIQDNCGRTCYCIAGELECSETAPTNATFTVSTTMATSVLSTETAITLVTRSSAASSTRITSSSEIRGTTLSFLSEPFTTGVTTTPVPITSMAGSEGTTGAGGSIFTSPGSLPGSTGASASTATEAEATSDSGFRAGGTGAPTAPATGGEEYSTSMEPSTGATSPGGSGTTGKPAEGITKTPITNGGIKTNGTSHGITRTTVSKGQLTGATGTSALGSGTSGPSSAAASGAPGGTSAEAVGTTGAGGEVTGTAGVPGAGSRVTEASSGVPGRTGASSAVPGATVSSAGLPATTRVSVAGAGTTGPAAGGESRATGPGEGGSSTAGSPGAATGTSGAGASGTAAPAVTGSGAAAPSSGGAATTVAAGSGTSGPAGEEGARTSGSPSGAAGTTPVSAVGSGATSASGVGSRATQPSSGVVSGTAGVPAGAAGTTVSAGGLSGATSASALGSGTSGPSPAAASGAPGGTSAEAVGTTGAGGSGATSASGVGSRATQPSSGVVSGTAGVPAGAAGTTVSAGGLSGATSASALGSGTSGPSPAAASGAPGGTSAEAVGTTGAGGSGATSASGVGSRATQPSSGVVSGTAGVPAGAAGTTVSAGGLSGATSASALGSGTSGPSPAAASGAPGGTSAEAVGTTGAGGEVTGTAGVPGAGSRATEASSGVPGRTGASSAVPGATVSSAGLPATSRVSVAGAGTTGPAAGGESRATGPGEGGSSTAGSPGAATGTSGAGASGTAAPAVTGSGAAAPSSGGAATTVAAGSGTSGPAGEEGARTSGSPSGAAGTTPVSAVGSGATSASGVGSRATQPSSGVVSGTAGVPAGAAGTTVSAGGLSGATSASALGSGTSGPSPAAASGAPGGTSAEAAQAQADRRLQRHPGHREERPLKRVRSNERLGCRFEGHSAILWSRIRDSGSASWSRGDHCLSRRAERSDQRLRFRLGHKRTVACSGIRGTGRNARAQADRRLQRHPGHREERPLKRVRSNERLGCRFEGHSAVLWSRIRDSGSASWSRGDHCLSRRAERSDQRLRFRLGHKRTVACSGIRGTGRNARAQADRRLQRHPGHREERPLKRVRSNERLGCRFEGHSAVLWSRIRDSGSASWSRGDHCLSRRAERSDQRLRFRLGHKRTVACSGIRGTGRNARAQADRRLQRHPGHREEHPLKRVRSNERLGCRFEGHSAVLWSRIRDSGSASWSRGDHCLSRRAERSDQRLRFRLRHKRTVACSGIRGTGRNAQAQADRRLQRHPGHREERPLKRVRSNERLGCRFEGHSAVLWSRIRDSGSASWSCGDHCLSRRAERSDQRLRFRLRHKRTVACSGIRGTGRNAQAQADRRLQRHPGHREERPLKRVRSNERLGCRFEGHSAVLWSRIRDSGSASWSRGDHCLSRRAERSDQRLRFRLGHKRTVACSGIRGTGRNARAQADRRLQRHPGHREERPLKRVRSNERLGCRFEGHSAVLWSRIRDSGSASWSRGDHCLSRRAERSDQRLRFRLGHKRTVACSGIRGSGATSASGVGSRATQPSSGVVSGTAGVPAGAAGTTVSAGGLSGATSASALGSGTSGPSPAAASGAPGGTSAEAAQAQADRRLQRHPGHREERPLKRVRSNERLGCRFEGHSAVLWSRIRDSGSASWSRGDHCLSRRAERSDQRLRFRLRHKRTVACSGIRGTGRNAQAQADRRLQRHPGHREERPLKRVRSNERLGCRFEGHSAVLWSRIRDSGSASWSRGDHCLSRRAERSDQRLRFRLRHKRTVACSGIRGTGRNAQAQADRRLQRHPGHREERPLKRVRSNERLGCRFEGHSAVLWSRIRDSGSASWSRGDHCLSRRAERSDQRLRFRLRHKRTVACSGIRGTGRNAQAQADRRLQRHPGHREERPLKRVRSNERLGCRFEGHSAVLWSRIRDSGSASWSRGDHCLSRRAERSDQRLRFRLRHKRTVACSGIRGTGRNAQAQADRRLQRHPGHREERPLKRVRSNERLGCRFEGHSAVLWSRIRDSGSASWSRGDHCLSRRAERSDQRLRFRLRHKRTVACSGIRGTGRNAQAQADRRLQRHPGHREERPLKRVRSNERLGCRFEGHSAVLWSRIRDSGSASWSRGDHCLSRRAERSDQRLRFRLRHKRTVACSGIRGTGRNAQAQADRRLQRHPGHREERPLKRVRSNERLGCRFEGHSAVLWSRIRDSGSASWSRGDHCLSRRAERSDQRLRFRLRHKRTVACSGIRGTGRNAQAQADRRLQRHPGHREERPLKRVRSNERLGCRFEGHSAVLWSRIRDSGSASWSRGDHCLSRRAERSDQRLRFRLRHKRTVACSGIRGTGRNAQAQADRRLQRHPGHREERPLKRVRSNERLGCRFEGHSAVLWSRIRDSGSASWSRGDHCLSRRAERSDQRLRFRLRHKRTVACSGIRGTGRNAQAQADRRLQRHPGHREERPLKRVRSNERLGCRFEGHSAVLWSRIRDSGSASWSRGDHCLSRRAERSDQRLRFRLRHKRTVACSGIRGTGRNAQAQADRRLQRHPGHREERPLKRVRSNERLGCRFEGHSAVLWSRIRDSGSASWSRGDHCLSRRAERSDQRLRFRLRHKRTVACSGIRGTGRNAQAQADRRLQRHPGHREERPLKRVRSNERLGCRFEGHSAVLWSRIRDSGSASWSRGDHCLSRRAERSDQRLRFRLRHKRTVACSGIRGTGRNAQAQADRRLQRHPGHREERPLKRVRSNERLGCRFEGHSAVLWSRIRDSGSASWSRGDHCLSRRAERSDQRLRFRLRHKRTVACSGIRGTGRNTTGPAAGGESRATGPGEGGSSTAGSPGAATGTSGAGASGTAAPAVTGSGAAAPSSGGAATTVAAGSGTSGPAGEEGARTSGSPSGAAGTTPVSAVGSGATSASGVGSRATQPSSGVVSGTAGVPAGAAGTTVSAGGLSGASNKEKIVTTEIDVSRGTSGESSRSTASGISYAGTTAGPEGQATESVTGTTRVIPGTTVAPGSSNTEATTSVGESGTTRAVIITGTTGSISGKSLEPGSASTEAKTPPGGSGTTQGGLPGGTTRELSGTTITSRGSNTEATTSTEETRTGAQTGAQATVPGSQVSSIQTGTSGVVSNPTIASSSSSTGTMVIALGTTVAPGSSKTDVTMKLSEGKTVLHGSFSGATTGVSVNEGTGSTLGTTRVAFGTTLEPGSSNTEATTPSGGNGTTGSGINTGGSSSQVTGILIVTTGVNPGRTTSSGSPNTEPTNSTEGSRTKEGATTGTSERPSPGSETGTTGVASGTTVASGSSNTGATTSLGSGETTQSGIKIVTAGGTAGTTIRPGSSNTTATTSPEVRATTGAETAIGTIKVASGTTVIPGSSSTGKSTFSTAVVPSRITGVPETSSPGPSKEASETTTAPGISTTASISVSTTSPTVSYPGCPESLPPPPVCHGPLGEEKSPGDIWTANCHQCTCTNENAVDCTLKECPSLPTCKAEERLVKFKDNDTCCEIGYCEPRTCLFNNTDYEVGDSFDDPNNPCVSYTCLNTGLTAVVQDCPKQTWCAEEDRVYDSKKCCYTCNTKCTSSPVNVTVNYNGCKKKVEMAKCVGECKKTLTYNYDMFQLENSCLCCREENYEYREIALDCPDGSETLYRYRHITTCSCVDPCQSQTSIVS